MHIVLYMLFIYFIIALSYFALTFSEQKEESSNLRENYTDS